MARDMVVRGNWAQLGAFVLGMWLVVRPFGRWLARRLDARTPIGAADRGVLCEAFAVLGVDRVALGLAATGHEWGECFLSYATAGAPFGYRPALRPGWRTRPTPHLTVDQTRTVVRVWDRKEVAFRALASEWLMTRGRPEATDTRVSPSLHPPRGTVASTALVTAHAR